MKVQMTYNGKTVEVEVADDQFEKLFVDKKTGYERVSGTSYWRISSGGLVIGDADYNTAVDRGRYEFANYFSDKSVAENIARAQRLWNKIHRRAVEMCDPVDIRESGEIYMISFDTISNALFVERSYIYRPFGCIYFDSRKRCNEVIT